MSVDRAQAVAMEAMLRLIITAGLHEAGGGRAGRASIRKAHRHVKSPLG